MRSTVGISDARLEARRFDDETLDLGAVLAREVDVFDLAEPDPGERLVVGVRESGEVDAVGEKHLRRQVGLGHDGGDAPVAADRELTDRARTADGGADRASVDRHPREVLFAVVLHRREHRAPVSRELRVEHVAVEFPGENRGLAAGGGSYREVVGGVDIGGGVGGAPVGDQGAVGRKGRRFVRSRIGGHLDEGLTLVGVVRVHDPDVGVVVAVGIARPVAGEGDRIAVRRPHGLGVVIVPRRDLGQAFRLQIENKEVGPAAVEIADVVLLELAAGDDPRAAGSRVSSRRP